MMHMGDDFSRQEAIPTQQVAPNKTCPDCGEPAPEETGDGDVCCQCGGIFHQERN